MVEEHQVRTGQVRIGQVRTGQVGTGQVEKGQVGTGQVVKGQVGTGQPGFWNVSGMCLEGIGMVSVKLLEGIEF